MVEEALSEYRTATKVFPQNARFHVVLGALQYSQGRRDEALRTLRGALAADSTFHVALEMTARIHAERNDFQQAIHYARRLANGDREPSRAAALHGWVAEQLGLIDEAVDAYGRAIEKDPTRTDLTLRRRKLVSESQENKKDNGL
jgi:tetratricopeptide (TPR) repeat protein